MFELFYILFILILIIILIVNYKKEKYLIYDIESLAPHCNSLLCGNKRIGWDCCNSISCWKGTHKCCSPTGTCECCYD